MFDGNLHPNAEGHDLMRTYAQLLRSDDRHGGRIPAPHKRQNVPDARGRRLFRPAVRLAHDSRFALRIRRETRQLSYYVRVRRADPEFVQTGSDIRFVGRKVRTFVPSGGERNVQNNFDLSRSSILARHVRKQGFSQQNHGRTRAEYLSRGSLPSSFVLPAVVFRTVADSQRPAYPHVDRRNRGYDAVFRLAPFAYFQRPYRRIGDRLRQTHQTELRRGIT